jgi:hypothetical protein
MEASSPVVRQRAEVLGRLMREEKGVQNAVTRLEQLLATRRTKAAVINLSPPADGCGFPRSPQVESRKE